MQHAHALTATTTARARSKSNLGLDGIQAFLKAHKCNKMCRSLGLPEITSTTACRGGDTVLNGLGECRTTTGSHGSQGSCSGGEWAPPAAKRGVLNDSPVSRYCVRPLQRILRAACRQCILVLPKRASAARLVTSAGYCACFLFGRTASVSPLRLPAVSIPEGRAKSPLRWCGNQPHDVIAIGIGRDCWAP